MKKTYKTPDLKIMLVDLSGMLLAASIGGFTGFDPEDLIDGGTLTDED